MELPCTVTLVSNRNDNIFAHNKSFDFSNILPRPLEVQDCEVALEKITYYDRYIVDETQPEVSTALAVPSFPFFDLEKKENEIIYEVTESNRLDIPKGEEGHFGFINKLNRYFEEAGGRVKLRIDVRFKRENEINIIDSLEIVNEVQDRELVLTYPFNQILGFRQEVFTQGRVQNEFPPDLLLFNSQPTDKYFTIELLKKARKEVYVDQMEAGTRLELVVHEIEQALRKDNVQVVMAVNKVNFSVVYSIQGRVRFLLSEFLNKYLGLDENFHFVGEGSIRVPEKLVYPDKMTEISSPAGEKVLVLADIISDQVFAGEEKKILATFDRKETPDFEKFSFSASPLIYKPLCVERISQIKISLQTDTYEFLPSYHKPTVVSLNFRKCK